jgi:ureidoglycolate lyase/seryl-tRNA synthetase
MNSLPQVKTCIDIDSNPSLADGACGVHEAEWIVASDQSLKGYGHFVDDFDLAQVEIVTWPALGWRTVREGTGNEGGTTEGRFEFFRDGGLMCARNHAVGGHYITGWFDDPATAGASIEPSDTGCVYVREANYHPDGGQIFSPVSGSPFIALLALPGDDIEPSDFKAFYFDGTRGIHINPSVWHQPVYPIEPTALFDDRQGKVHACIACDFVREFGVYIKVPLRAN